MYSDELLSSLSLFSLDRGTSLMFPDFILEVSSWSVSVSSDILLKDIFLSSQVLPEPKKTRIQRQLHIRIVFIL